MQTVKTRFSTGIGSTLNIFAHVLAKIRARHAFRYSTSIAFVGFPTYSPCTSVIQCSLFPRLLLSLSSFFLHVYTYTYIYMYNVYSFFFSVAYGYLHTRVTRTTFWPCVPVRLVEGLLRIKISVRKFRSAAAFESVAKLDINLAVLDAVLCPSILLRLPFFSSYAKIVR